MFGPLQFQTPIMNVKYEFFLLTICAIEVCTCDSEVNNSTSSSRREILEKQARVAYQNACFRLQELSNWMTVVFRIKSVWASSTVNEMAAKSDGILNESVRRILPNLPSRPKALNAECSLRSVQVTAQTYAYLQSQMILLKIILGRNAIKSSKERLDGANVSIRERVRMLDIFNTTLNDILYKLKQNTEEASTQVNSDNWKAWNVIKDIQEGRFLQYLQDPTAFFRSAREQDVFNSEQARSARSTNFFQNLGKTLDRIIFPKVPSKLNSTVIDSA